MKRFAHLFLFIILMSTTCFAVDNLTTGRFYRAQNFAEKKGLDGVTSNRYITVIHDEGSADATSQDFHAVYMATDGTHFTEPGTIIYLKTGYDLQAMGTGIKEISSGYNVNIEKNGTDSNGETLWNAYVRASMIIFSVNVYFQDESGFDKASEGSYDDSKWYITPIDVDGTGDEYFGVAPKSTDRIGDKYYTTLRTSFGYNLSNGVKAYVVQKNNGKYELIEIQNTVPSNTPVILECSSTNPSDNRLFPISKNVNIKYTTASSLTTSSLLVAGTNYKYFKTSIVNAKNGETGSYTRGQAYGFGTAFSTGNENYKVLSVKDGKLGFFDKFTDAYPNDLCINGELAYMNTTEDIVLLEEAELATIVSEGTDGAAYVTNNLYGVAVAGGKLYAKDNNQYATPSVKPADAIDYMAHANLQTGYDQSNWVALNVANPGSYIDKDLTVRGTLLRKPNPEMTVTKITATAPASSGYTPNVYIPANFMGETQTSTVGNQNTYFFVTPKPQEYAHISWAVYGGDGKFYVNAPEGSSNLAHIKGGFIANDEMMPAGTNLSHFTVGNSYEFNAIIQRASTSNLSLRATPYTDGGFSTDWVVYPLEAPEGTPTTVTDIFTTKSVTGIKYYNLAGMASDVPFDGINIRVTTYSDGTRQASKIRF